MEAKISHTTRVKAVKVTDIDALRAAVDTLARERNVKITLEENTGARLWSTEPKFPYVVKVKDCRFDVGFERGEDGSYTPVFDAHGGYLAQFVGGGQKLAKTPEEQMLSNIGGLMQAYTREVLTRTAQMQGALVTTSTTEDGTVVLQVY